MRVWLMTLGIVCCSMFATAARAQAQAPCCSITTVDAKTGIVSAKVNASGAEFQFRLTNANLLKELRVGQGVYANFGAKQISLDGKSAAGAITSEPQAIPAPVPSPSPVPKPAIPLAAAPTGRPAPTVSPSSATRAPQPAPTNQDSATSAPKEEKAPSNQPPAGGSAPPALNGSWYLEHSFQLCCEYVVVPGQSTWYVSVNGQPGWYLNIAPIPGYKWVAGPGGPNGGYAPLFVNFWTRQASVDGVTACCTIIGDAMHLTEPVYLDALPIGVIYMPPGDPRATGSSTPSQAFSTTATNQNTSTTLNVSIVGETTTYKATFAGSGVTGTTGSSTQNSTQLSNQQTHSVVESVGTVVGPGGYPGEGDLIWGYLNPVFDVHYIGGYNYPGIPVGAIPSEPQYVATSMHNQQASDPGYPYLWELFTCTVTELQTNNNPACLALVLKTPPKAGVPFNPEPVNPITQTTAPVAVTQPLTLVQRLLQMDPMAPTTSKFVIPAGLAGGFATALGSSEGPPAFATNNPRFTLLADVSADGIQWNYCTNPAPQKWSATNTVTFGTQYSQVNKSTSSVSGTLDPYQAIADIAANNGQKWAAGSDASISFQESWEVDTSVTTATQQSTTLNTTITWGGGMTPQLYPAPETPNNTWAPNTTYPSPSAPNGSYVLPTQDNTFQYIVKTAGTSGGTEPTWCTTTGCTVIDGTVVWALYGLTCAHLPEFTTWPYYDEMSDTVLFWTTQNPASSTEEMVNGHFVSSQPGNYRVVFTQVGGPRRVTVFADSMGHFRVQLPAGDYTYQVIDSAGKVRTKAPVHATVINNQSRLLQLPAININ